MLIRFLSLFIQFLLETFFEHLGGLNQSLQGDFLIGAVLQRKCRLEHGFEQLIAEFVLGGGHGKPEGNEPRMNTDETRTKIPIRVSSVFIRGR